MTAAAALELFQAAALIHDDVMDGSDTRRGQPAVHRRFAACTAARAGAAPPRRSAWRAAILPATCAWSWTDEMYAAPGCRVERCCAARPTFDRMRTELMGGQYLDVLEQAQRRTTVESSAARDPLQEREVHRSSTRC